MNNNKRASLVATIIFLGAALGSASATTAKTAVKTAAQTTLGGHASTVCNGGASLSGWYGMLVSGNTKFISGAVKFDGNCNVSGANISGGTSGKYATTSVTGTYGQNADGTFALSLKFANSATPQTYVIGVSESGNKARGIESDGMAGANIDIQSQLTPLTSGYSVTSLNGTYVASCYGGDFDELDTVTFDGNGNIFGSADYNLYGSQGTKSLSGTYSVNGDGTFAGSLSGSYSFNGVIETGVSEIEYTYASGTSGVAACIGKQAAASSNVSSNLLGYYGFVVGGISAGGWGEETLSGSLYFDGNGNVSATNVNGGINAQYGNGTAAGSYTVNSDNTVSITMNLANPGTTQTYVVGVSEAGAEAAGIQTDGAALANIDLQSQLQLPGATYSNASLIGTYAASCSGREYDLNYVTFDGNGNIIAGVDAYYDGGYGDNPYAGTYSVNSDGTFTGNFFGNIYDVFTMTGVLDNATGEMEYTYYLSGTGGMVSCVGESTYGPVSSSPVAATPTFSPLPGVFAGSELVTLSDATPGAVIYYTTNGTAPTSYSAVYNSPIEVSATTTIEAIAFVPGYNNSAIGAGTYFSGQGQSITFPSVAAETYPASPINLSAASSSGLPVTYSIVSGPATLSGHLLTFKSAGSVTVQASQAGNAQYAAAPPVTQTFTANPQATAVALTSSSTLLALGQTVSLTATITPQFGGAASGSVTFMDGASVLATVPVTANVAKLTTSALVAGTNSVIALYSGNTNCAGSTSPSLSVVAVQASTTLVSSVNPSVSGKSVTLTATVTSAAGAPAGTVSFLNGSTVLATVALNAGTAKLSTTKLPPGSNSITAVYNGKTSAGSTPSAPLSQVVLAATTTTLASGSNPSAFGQTLNLTATVNSSIGAPADGETVTFESGATVIGTGVLSGGTASLSISTLAVGTQTLRAVYGGDASFASSTSNAVSQAIAKDASATTLISSQNPSTSGQAVTFTATVTSALGATPTGTVTFKNGTATLGTVALSGGSASYSTSKLALGTLTISATYNGSTDVAASAATLTQTVN